MLTEHKPGRSFASDLAFFLHQGGFKVEVKTFVPTVSNVEVLFETESDAVAHYLNSCGIFKNKLPVCPLNNDNCTIVNTSNNP